MILNLENLNFVDIQYQISLSIHPEYGSYIGALKWRGGRRTATLLTESTPTNGTEKHSIDVELLLVGAVSECSKVLGHQTRVRT